MSNSFVTVNITRQTKAVSQKGFGLPLILSTEKLGAYKEYDDIAGIGEDYGESSETYKLASKVFGQTPKVATVAVYGFVYDSTADEPTALSAALNQLVKTNSDFFYLVSTEQGDDEIKELANWTGTQKKFYFYSTANHELPGTILTENSVGLVHENPETYPAEGWVGVIAPLEVGSFTGTFKTISGIAPSNYDSPTIKEIEANNGNVYIREGGVNITGGSKTGSGEYFDVVQGAYYLESRMVENVFGMLVRNPKVPFTYAGIAMGVAEVEKTLKDGANSGIIAVDASGTPLFSVTTPDLADISTNDKANRTLPNIPWTATIAGAIERVTINGVLTL